MNLTNYIYDVPDFPEKGIVFRDITPLLAHPKAFDYCISLLAENAAWADVIVWLDARGFIFGWAVAHKLKLPFVPIRKIWKLPRETLSESYSLEYDNNTFEIHTDAIQPGQKVALIDDVLATGGTMRAACNLVEKLGWEIQTLNFVMELAFLGWEKTLSTYTKKSLVVYN